MIRLLVAFIALLAMASSAFAQDGSSRRRGGPSFRLTETLEGKADEPMVELLIVRENLKMEFELSLEESFLPKIRESVEKEPF